MGGRESGMEGMRERGGGKRETVRDKERRGREESERERGWQR